MLGIAVHGRRLRDCSQSAQGHLPNRPPDPGRVYRSWSALSRHHGGFNVYALAESLSEKVDGAGVMLLPGVGWDVVPSDCLAAHTAAQIENPQRLRIALQVAGSMSRGSAVSAGEIIGVGLLARSGWSAPAIKTTTPTAIGTARASAGSCISTAASATPSGKAAIPNTVHTKKYPTPTSAVSADPGACRLSCQRPGGSATALGPWTAASSPPSSRPTCRGTTPRRRATSVRASASTPSTSSSRRASASRPSPTWTHPRRSSPRRWRRRAALRRRRRLAGKLARKPCVVGSPVPRLRQRHPRLDSALVVFVVAAPPDARLVAPLGGTIDPLVHTPEAVQSARIGGIGVVDDAVLEHERAHARPIARVCGRVGSACGRELGDGLRARCRGHRVAAAPVVVVDAPLALLLLGERDVEVEVEVAAERGCPGKRPPHPPLVRLQLRERRPRHRRKRDVVVRQVDDEAVEPVRDRRAGHTPRRVVGPEHEVVDEELRAPSGEVCQRSAPLFGLESILLADPDPRQLLPAPRQIVAAPRELLFRLEQLEPG